MFILFFVVLLCPGLWTNGRSLAGVDTYITMDRRRWRRLCVIPLSCLLYEKGPFDIFAMAPNVWRHRSPSSYLLEFSLLLLQLFVSPPFRATRSPPLLTTTSQKMDICSSTNTHTASIVTQQQPKIRIQMQIYSRRIPQRIIPTFVLDVSSSACSLSPPSSSSYSHPIPHCRPSRDSFHRSFVHLCATTIRQEH